MGFIWIFGGWHFQGMSKCLSFLYFIISNKNYSSSLSCWRNWSLGGRFRGSSGRWYPQTLSKYLPLTYLLISKTQASYTWSCKNLIFGGPPWEGGTLKLCQNICLLYLLISKNKTGTLIWAKQKINIWRVHFGGYSQMMSKHLSLRYLVIFWKN